MRSQVSLLNTEGRLSSDICDGFRLYFDALSSTSRDVPVDLCES